MIHFVAVIPAIVHTYALDNNLLSRVSWPRGFSEKQNRPLAFSTAGGRRHQQDNFSGLEYKKACASESALGWIRCYRVVNYPFTFLLVALQSSTVAFRRSSIYLLNELRSLARFLDLLAFELQLLVLDTAAFTQNAFIPQDFFLHGCQWHCLMLVCLDSTSFKSFHFGIESSSELHALFILQEIDVWLSILADKIHDAAPM